MRRKDREISEMEEIIEIIQKCEVCRLAFFDEEYPYLIPLNFGYSYEIDGLELYFHGASKGKKINLITNNNKVSFEMDCSHQLIPGEQACDYTMEFESVCGNGIIEFIHGDKKIDALTQIMKQYSAELVYEFSEKYLKEVAVYKVKVKEITAKRKLS